MHTQHIIGLTGGIGSGKSFISRLLADHFDVPIFNCDLEAHRLMHQSPNLRASLTQLVGNDLYDDRGRLNRPLLANYMFVGGNVARVNAIVHPAVREWFAQWCAILHRHEVLGIESAILFESGFEDLCTEVWNITAPLELRIQRCMARDNATRQQVLDRINHQMSDDERTHRSHLVIVNDEVTDPLVAITQRLHDIAPQTNISGALDGTVAEQ